jgi:hypothetical protein
MKWISLLFVSCLFALSSSGQQAGNSLNKPDSARPIQILDVACGQCKLGLKADGCTLAVRVNGKAYFVDGTSIDEHGDAHGKDGFCNAIRKAEVQGEIVGDRVVVTYFKLLPQKKKVAKNSK